MDAYVRWIGFGRTNIFGFSFTLRTLPPATAKATTHTAAGRCRPGLAPATLGPTRPAPALPLDLFSSFPRPRPDITSLLFFSVSSLFEKLLWARAA
jgi:hypothetical protein